MAIVSKRVASGIEVLATAYNNLRTDLLSNHDHTSGQGAVINHGALADNSIAGTYHTHGDTEKHMDGVLNSFSDAPGGEKGVHGILSTTSLFGCGGRSTQTEGSTASALDGLQYVQIFGTFTPHSADADIKFGSTFTFDTIGGVWASGVNASPSRREHMDYYIYDVSVTGFSIKFGTTPSLVYWRALGTKT